MSVKIMAEVWELNLPQNEKFVLLAFADHADDAGYCFPSIARVGWKTGYKERQVREICGKLRSRGLLESVKYHKGGRGKARVYRVRPEKGAKNAPFSESERVWLWGETLRPSAGNPALASAPQSSLTTKEPSSASGRKAGRSVGMFSGKNGSGNGSGLFNQAKEYFIQTWQKRFSSKPTWGSKDYSGLARILRRHPELTIAEFRARWDRYICDGDPFIANRMGHSLAFFCSRFDAYINRSGLDIPEFTGYED